MTPERLLLGEIGEMRGEAFDLGPRPIDHLLEVGDELFVDRVVGGSESVERSRAGSVENAEHGELFVSGGPDERRVPATRLL
jgi:hypothetical protein